jgi:hypothetical protein
MNPRTPKQRDLLSLPLQHCVDSIPLAYEPKALEFSKFGTSFALTLMGQKPILRASDARQ